MDVAVVNYLIYNILSVLETEASLLWGVHDAVDDIKDELISMQSFLVDADKKREGSEGEKTWVANVRDMAYEVEDVIDKFMYHINSQRIGGRSTRLLHHTIYFPQNLWVRYQTATKIQKINRKIKGIPERNQRYDIDHVGESTSSKDNSKWVVQHAESSLFFKEDELVGIEKKRKLLMGWLVDGELHQTVISIVGMGGLGKTTLIANTYNNDSVKRHFECYAWITVSQAYVIEDLLKSLIKEFYESRKEVHPTDLSSKNYRELIEILVYYLQNKRYLLVLDDVWETRPLNQIKVSLPDSCLKSRIILTTRNENVACFHFGVESHVYHIQELQKEEAWELFCKKAFSSSSNRCPLELESFARKLVEKCEGLPLAIAALGSLMYSKNKSQWNKIDKSLDWRLSKNPELDIVERILLLSFNDLPHQLKHCFLYCSLFPEDYMIRRRRLMKLWIAEGFVEQVQGSTLEEVAEGYLGELIFRSMLQVVWRNDFGRPKACKMHDVMREVALAISERQRFCVVHDGGETTKECKARRMSIHKIDRELESFTGISKLRSFLVFNRMLKILPSEGKMLRVLDLEDAPINVLSDELFNLFNLRYLNLRGTLVKELPKSIGRLLNLQTLDIKNTQIEVLPREIGKLQNLRHLIVHHYTTKWNDFNYVIGARIPSNICRLKNLQVVSYLEANGDLIRQIQSLTQLTMIRISIVKEVDEMDLCVSIQNMKLLRYLCIMVTNVEETLRMDALSSPPPNLQKLVLVGKLGKVPQWFRSLQNLTFLFLHWSRLNEDLLPHIAALPHLRRLSLNNAYVGKQLCFNTGFPKLTRLTIRNFPQLDEIIIEQGMMPNMKSLSIVSCMELKTVPKGIEYLNLQELILRSPSLELKNRIEGQDSVDFPKVQHISMIYLLT